jgi:hypothetical protein
MPKVYNKRNGDAPPGSVYVGRPTRLGNPFTVEKYGRGKAIKMYAVWIMEPENRKLRKEMRRKLKGKDLVCWCAPDPCHANIIMEIANL